MDIPSQHWHTRHSGQISSRPHTTKNPKWWFSEEHPFISGEPKLVKCEFIWPEYIHTLMAYWSTFGPFRKILPLLKRTRSLGNFRPSFLGFPGWPWKNGPWFFLVIGRGLYGLLWKIPHYYNRVYCRALYLGVYIYYLRVQTLLYPILGIPIKPPVRWKVRGLFSCFGWHKIFSSKFTK